MATDETITKILSAVKRPVRFKYPGTEGELNGTLTDRVVLPAGQNIGGVHYWDVIDLIDFSGEGGLQSQSMMRIGYYRKPKNTLNWGSQTTITEPFSTWKELFVKAAQEKKWFRDFLDEVMTELRAGK
jgi:hypothetical protein